MTWFGPDGSCGCCGCPITSITPDEDWTGWTGAEFAGEIGLVDRGITATQSISRPTGNWTVDIQVENIEAFTPGIKPSISVGDLTTTFQASATQWTIEPQLVTCTTYSRLRSATPTGFWLRYQETTLEFNGETTRRRRITIYDRDPNTTSPAPVVLGFHCDETSIEGDEEYEQPTSVVVSLAGGDTTMDIGTVRFSGTAEDDPGCHTVDQCLQCLPSWNAGNCAQPYYPRVIISNVPDLLTIDVEREYQPCVHRPNCQPTNSIFQRGTYRLSGFSAINGTYAADVYDVTGSGPTNYVATPACLGTPGCKYWGFPKVTFTLTLTRQTEIDWDAWQLTSNCIPPGYVQFDNTFTFDVVFDPIMGCIYPLINTVGGSPMRNMLVDRFPYARYSVTGTGFITRGSNPVPLLPVEHQRQYEFAPCATAAVPSRVDTIDSVFVAFNDPLFQEFFPLPVNRTYPRGSLNSLNAPNQPSFSSAAFPGPGLNRQFPDDVSNTRYADGRTKETTALVLVNQADWEQNLTYVDINVPAAQSISNFNLAPGCPLITTYDYGAFRVTREFIAVGPAP